MGRVGVITHRERHDGGFNIVHIKDAIDNSFATRESNVFVIGREKPWISLPKGKGVKVSFENPRPLTMMLMCPPTALNCRGEGSPAGNGHCELNGECEGELWSYLALVAFSGRPAAKRLAFPV